MGRNYRRKESMEGGGTYRQRMHVAFMAAKLINQDQFRIDFKIGARGNDFRPHVWFKVLDLRYNVVYASVDPLDGWPNDLLATQLALMFQGGG